MPHAVGCWDFGFFFPLSHSLSPSFPLSPVAPKGWVDGGGETHNGTARHPAQRLPNVIHTSANGGPDDAPTAGETLSLFPILDGNYSPPGKPESSTTLNTPFSLTPIPYQKKI
ncbi:hypothetical protein MAPG_08702 [Magnaporthiopsis poae ATCC 64411]|uniref:Uncharacterized protein n=1 Tax=Magnaporthiopsis poae (strain ATCC 64411 / 73-15) TaxID=644358 RepID=A0A0C4E816_MAGP6|nr:hypothetical protein MAPG_08702 [Magnaporthiopsis poae ATCC 64411]